MAIITISRGSYGRGKAVAEKVADKLGFTCIGRDVVLEASSQFNIPEVRLIRNIRNAPSILDRIPYGKEQYIAFIQSALLKQFQRDSVIYHGIAGQFFLKGISHVLKVRIIADLEERVRAEMEREKITREEAILVLERDDEERRKWGKYLYGIDTWDPRFYDLVIQIKELTIDDAVEMISNTVRLRQFQTTPESRQAMDDLALAAQVKAALISQVPNIDVAADKGVITITSPIPKFVKEQYLAYVEKVAMSIPGVRGVVA